MGNAAGDLGEQAFGLLGGGCLLSYPTIVAGRLSGGVRSLPRSSEWCRIGVSEGVARMAGRSEAACGRDTPTFSSWLGTRTRRAEDSRPLGSNHSVGL